MTAITIILLEDGRFDTVFSGSEVDVVVLKRGTDDRQIDAAETELTEITFEA